MKTTTKPKVKKEVKIELPCNCWYVIETGERVGTICMIHTEHNYEKYKNRQKSLDHKRKYHTDDKCEIIIDPNNKDTIAMEKAYWKYQGTKQEVEKESWLKRLLKIKLPL